MQAPAISQPIEFWGVKTPVTDIMGGQSGTPEFLHRQLGEVVPLRSKRDETGSASVIKQQYAITFWKNAVYNPAVDHTVRWKGLALTIQIVDYLDATQRKYRLIAVQQ